MPLLARLIICKKKYNILSASNELAEVFVADEKYLNCLINFEKQITDLLKQDFKVLSDTNYDKLKPEVPDLA